MNSTDKEIELQSRLRADDKDALETIYLAYREEFINFSKRYKVRENDALDIFQDSVIVLHQKFVTTQLVLKSSSIKTYLFAIGKNKIFKHLKQEQRLMRVEIEEHMQEKAPEEDQEITQQQKELALRIEQISESCREVLKLFYYRNLTMDEIVSITHYKDANTVRSHKSRCLKHLKTLFKPV